MSPIRQNRITVELADGTVVGPVRVIFADKLRLERTARASNWDISRDEFRVQSFLAWAALNRTGDLAEGVGYEQFLEQLIDIQFDANSEADEDPTTADTSA